MYSGTVADFSGSDPIIYREPLQTEQYDSLSLNGKFLVGGVGKQYNVFLF